MSRSFDIFGTPLQGLKLLQRKPIGDDRGYLERLFCAEELKAAGIHQPIVQINRTLTRRKGAVRGMHFQLPPYAETKLVSCLRGVVFDVAVDLRKGSRTFLGWHGQELSATNLRSLLIPEGFAHGFQALTDDCELLYLHTAAYQSMAEGALNATDPRLAIEWPMEILEMSERDRCHPMLAIEFDGIEP
jgi:dTDP-4-dehydrorhamnose 3,5-epimerase